MEYTVIIHTAKEGGYWVDVPVLPGCYSQGETIEEALKNIREAIELHLDGLKEDKNKKIPQDMDFIISRVTI
jgi:predicted RNase H-like HicB family nuclease